MFETTIKGFKVFDEDGKLIRFYRGTRKNIKEELNKLNDEEYFKKKFPSYEFGELKFVRYRKKITLENRSSYLKQNRVKNLKEHRKSDYNTMLFDSLMKRLKKLVDEYNNHMFDLYSLKRKILKIETSLNYGQMCFSIKVHLMDSASPVVFNFSLNVEYEESRKYNNEKIKEARNFLK